MKDSRNREKTTQIKLQWEGMRAEKHVLVIQAVGETRAANALYLSRRLNCTEMDLRLVGGGIGSASSSEVDQGYFHSF